MSNIKLFNGQEVRTHWDADKEEWFFSVVDVCRVLAGSAAKDPGAYWRKLKQRIKEESGQPVTFCHGLKMLASDGKMRDTDAADTKGVLRLVQSIPSPNAEPFKMWLAKVGAERIDAIVDPEKSFEQGISDYTKKGYSREWINQRLLSIEVRTQLTNEWQDRGVEGNSEYAILTNEMTQAWSGKSIKSYKAHKKLKKENLRDNMTNLELVLNMLAEATTTEISQKERPAGFDESLGVAIRGGLVAGRARLDIEREVGQSIISAANAKTPKALDETRESLLSTAESRAVQKPKPQNGMEGN